MQVSRKQNLAPNVGESRCQSQPFGAVSIGQAMLVANRPFFGKRRRGDRPPARHNGWAFLFFFIDLS